tara:strand:+ start:11155 stop:12678 length:1524 start_codon:yes stop_codon:yes gene_type:complete
MKASSTTVSNIGENTFFTVMSIVFLTAIYIYTFGISLFGRFGEIAPMDLGSLTIPSVILFIFICTLSIWKRKFYFIFLIFVILAFPSPIDDIFPSVYITNPDDKIQVAFPLITRVDIYLLLGIIIGILKNKLKLNTIQFNLIIKLFLISFTIVFLLNFYTSSDIIDLNQFIAYSFHIRYFILLLILLSLYDIRKYEQEIVLSFVISIIFLYVEAQLNTYMKGLDRLTSGSLSLNTFANISAAILVYITYLYKNNLINKSKGIAIFTIVSFILLGSGTRGAILTLIISFFFLYLLSNLRRLGINIIKIILAVILISITYVELSNKGYIPERYSYEVIAQKINIDFSKENFADMVQVQRTKETSSIKSRVDLFDSSINMIFENPLTGIGVGRWNRYKNNYSTHSNIVKVLLDPHNDYLALMSQYGIILGLLFAIIIFAYPFFLFLNIKKKDNGKLKFLYVVNITMGLAAMSNAGFFKHQVAAVLIFCLCVLLQLNQDYKNGFIQSELNN